ncbi:MAG: hypothetical protein WD512_07125, partial [Candidatus Paceibacterota bacterium]
ERYWSNRDSSAAQMGLGKAWALLKAGCDFSIDEEGDSMIDIKIEFKGFAYFEIGSLDSDYFYIPTEKTLNEYNGEDWY